MLTGCGPAAGRRRHRERLCGASAIYRNTPLQLFPHLSADVGLAQYPAEQFSTNVSLMRIRYPDGHVPTDHELMPPTGIRPANPTRRK